MPLLAGSSDLRAKRRWWRISLVVLVLGFSPSLFYYFLGLWQREHYQFFPLAIAGAIYLARRDLAGENETVTRPWWGLAVGLCALAGYAASAWLWSPWLGYLSFLTALAALLLVVGGWPLVRAAVPAFIMMATIIRPPMNLDTELALKLRYVAVGLSTYLLDFVRVPHFVNGVVIEIPWDRLLVEEACSGINSTFFVFAFAVFQSLRMKRRWPHGVLLVLLGFSFVILGNVVRITAGAFFRYRYGIDLLTGWSHEVFGLVLFVAYIVLILSADALLSLCLGGLEEAPASKSVIWSELLNRWLGPQMSLNAVRGCALMALVFLGVGAAQMVLATQQINKPKILVPSRLKPGAHFVLPEFVAGWRNSTGKIPMGTQHYIQIGAIHSQVWTLEKGGLQLLVALSYPYHGWHDLNYCYSGHGWKLTDPVFRTDGVSDKQSIIEVEMSRKPMHNAYLLYSAFTEDGEWQPPGRLEKRFSIRPDVDEDIRTTYQVQLLYMGYAPLPPEEKAEVLQLFLEVRKLLMQQVYEQLVPSTAKSIPTRK
ncbi:MAG: exosortase U [Verrucomicrobiae bacterium]|nr:exosortase U [Verrucomicrobiae bacterium]